MTELTANQESAIQDGMVAIVGMLNLIGAEDGADHAVAKILVDSEMQLRAVLAFVQATMGARFFFMNHLVK